MKFLENGGTPTLSTKQATDKDGKVLVNKDGSEMRRVSFNLTAKSLYVILPLLSIAFTMGAFAWQSTQNDKKQVAEQDTLRKDLKIQEDLVDTLENTVIINQHILNEKLEMITMLLDPKNGKKKLQDIDKKGVDLLKKLEARKKKEKDDS